jgi:hypothetical protein
MNLQDILAPLDSTFSRCGIRYAVIGGYAVAAWGEERATRDVDLLCDVGDSNVLIAALNQDHLRFVHRIGDYDDPISEIIRIDMGPIEVLFEVDVLIGLRDAPAGILDRVRTVHIGDLAIPVASPEDMILLKLLGGSARDFEDARSIVQVQGNRLDSGLIRRLCPGRIKDILEQLI